MDNTTPNVQEGPQDTTHSEPEFTYDLAMDVLSTLTSSESLVSAVQFMRSVACLPEPDFDRAKAMILIAANKLKCKTIVSQSLTKYRRDYEKEKKAEIRAKQKAEEEARRKAKQDLINQEHMIEFDPGNPDIPFLYGGTLWGGDTEGMFTVIDGEKHYFCLHPIQPIKIHYNIETGKYETTLAFRKKNREEDDIEQWQTVTVPKLNLSKANTIVELASFGIHISSETAKTFVRYLTDIEILNESIIPFEKTTSKLGWRDKGKYFLPYDTELLFDAKDRFKNLYESLKPAGDFDTWLEMTKQIRAGKSLAPRIAMAVSFASVLVGKLDLLPFIADFWGNTENGKTVLLMLAASIWANPAENIYVGSFKSTDTAFEVQCDVLNSLPLILDDSSHAANNFNFENFVYGICSGKGKSRSNRYLGKNRETNWKNASITNGERPLSSMVSQGGAINRILEVHCNETIFDDPRKVVQVCSANYGYAGRLFIQRLKEETKDDDGVASLKQDFEFLCSLLKEKSMSKQRQALACVLLADRLAERWIFMDGKRLSPGMVDELLTDPDEVNEGARAYDFIMDVISSKPRAFDIESNCDQLGTLNLPHREANFYRSPLNKLLKDAGFNLEAFLSWAKANDLLVYMPKRLTRSINMPFKSEDGQIFKKKVQVVCIKLKEEDDRQENGTTSWVVPDFSP